MADNDIDAELSGLLNALGNARFQFWTCPIREHSERGAFGTGSPVVTVEWRGDVAHCTAPGCGRTSRDAAGQAGEVPWQSR